MKLDYEHGCKDYSLYPSNVRIVFNEEGINIAKFLKYTGFDYSKRNIWDTQNKYILQLKELIIKESHQYIITNMSNIPIHLGRAWTQMYRPSECISVHHHGYSLLTCVFYISVPEKSGDLILIDPRGSVIEYDIYRADAALGATSARFVPQEGALIFIPGYMLHYTENNLSNDTRICIAANFFRNQHPDVKERILPDEEYTSN